MSATGWEREIGKKIVDVEGNGEKLRIAPTYLLFYLSM
jgi:hypothetical protein